MRLRERQKLFMAQYRVLLPTEIETVPEETRCGAEESAFKIVQLECGVQ